MNKNITAEQETLLMTHAVMAMQHSYSPYSRFAVGACVLAANGKYYTGTNVENSSYGLTVCGERNAIFAAVSDGQTQFRALAVVTRKLEGSDLNSPCGACLQVLSEFFMPNTAVYMGMLEGKKLDVIVKKFEELLPFPFAKLDALSGTEK